MIKLSSKPITQASVTHLNSVQQIVLSEVSFEDKVRKASSKWDSKTSSAGKTVFKDVKDTLITMCVGVEICVYCEQNEATDIEHIYPKKLYPGKAFLWDNYVLVCGKCNTHHKSDKFRIFNPANSVTDFDITPARGTYRQPENDDALFINQRVEDPMDFLELDLVNKLFVFVEKYPEGTREFKKARYTKDLLGLNSREALVVSRKNAVKFYISRLEKLSAAKAAVDFPQLMDSINDDWGGIDQSQEFAIEKTRILDSIKSDILSYPHPTVWKELIRQRQKLPKTDSLLTQVPEVLTW